MRLTGVLPVIKAGSMEVQNGHPMLGDVHYGHRKSFIKIRYNERGLGLAAEQWDLFPHRPYFSGIRHYE